MVASSLSVLSNAFNSAVQSLEAEKKRHKTVRVTSDSTTTRALTLAEVLLQNLLHVVSVFGLFVELQAHEGAQRGSREKDVDSEPLVAADGLVLVKNLAGVSAQRGRTWCVNWGENAVSAT